MRGVMNVAQIPSKSYRNLNNKKTTKFCHKYLETNCKKKTKKKFDL